MIRETEKRGSGPARLRPRPRAPAASGACSRTARRRRAARGRCETRRVDETLSQRAVQSCPRSPARAAAAAPLRRARRRARGAQARCPRARPPRHACEPPRRRAKVRARSPAASANPRAARSARARGPGRRGRCPDHGRRQRIRPTPRRRRAEMTISGRASAPLCGGAVFERVVDKVGDCLSRSARGLPRTVNAPLVSTFRSTPSSSAIGS